ncbi:MAG: ATP-binding protein [Bacteroidota bacterium]
MENQLLIALNRNKLLKNVNISKIDLQNVRGKLITISEGEILYREGDNADIIFLVVSGEINILKKRLLGKTKSYIFLENDFFGHEEFFEETSRTSTAVALRDSYLISLTRDEIDALINQDDEILMNLREPIAEIDETVLLKKEEKKTDWQKEDVDDFKMPSTLEDKFQPFEKYVGTEESKVQDVFPSISDSFKPLDEELKEEEKIEHELGGPSLIQETPVADESKHITEPVEKKEGIKFRQTDEPKSTPEIPFDESAFLNEDGIPKAEFEMPDVQHAAEKKSDEDLTDALFKILGGAESTEPIPQKPTEPTSSFEMDEAFLASLNFGEPVQKKSETTAEHIPHVVEDEKIEPEIEEPKFEIEKPTEIIEPPKEETIQESIPELAIAEPQIKETVIPEKVRQEKIEMPKPKPSKEEATTIDELNMIIKAAELVNSNIRVDEALKNIVGVATNLTNAERGTLYLIDRDKDELWSIITLGDEMREIRLAIGEGLAGFVAKSGETINIRDVQKDPRFKADFDKASGYVTKNMICFPIKNNKGLIIGVLQLLNNKNGEFSKRDEEFLIALSIHAAIAIQNAELVEKLLQSERVQSLGKMTNFLIQDIKKPILVAKRYAEHLKNKQLSDDAVQVVNMLLEQITQVADLVQTTSSYSEGKTILRMVKVNLNETLSDYFSRSEQYVENRLCEIVNELDKDVAVKIDVKEFYQCYMSIVKNACDAMPDGGKIYISTKRLDKNIEIRFRDTGLGIPEGFKDKIFEPFVSVGKKEGTGLGLSITKNIVQNLNGTIAVQSVMGEGSTFIITLPISSVF